MAKEVLEIFNVILTSCLLVSITAALNEQQTVRQLSRKRESGSVECGQKTGRHWLYLRNVQV